MTLGGGILVTGASGFVGRALTRSLMQTGARVTAAVRLGSVAPEGLLLSPIEGLGPDTRWQAALAGCDRVVHLAARVHLTQDLAADRLTEYRRANVAGTMALARQAASAGVRRFVFVSSIKVNGEETRAGRLFRETDPPAPLDPYGVSKAEAEAALFDLAASNPGMELVVVRPPLVYGPGVKANFRTMMSWLNRGIPLPLGGIRNNRRSLVGLQNLVGLIETCLAHPAAANQVFLASDGEDLSTTELLRRTAIALEVTPRLIPVPVTVLQAVGRAAGKEPMLQRLCGSLQVDGSKARCRLAWCPPSTVTEELARTAAAFRSESGTR